MDKLSQHLNFRDSDQHLWNAIDAGAEVYDDDRQHVVTDDFDDQPKNAFLYNAELSEGIP